jgi:hypothetical protein
MSEVKFYFMLHLIHAVAGVTSKIVWCNRQNRANKCEFAVKVTSFVSSNEMLKAQLQTKRIGQTKEAIWQKCIHVCIINLHTHTHKCERELVKYTGTFVPKQNIQQLVAQKNASMEWRFVH